MIPQLIIAVPYMGPQHLRRKILGDQKPVVILFQQRPHYVANFSALDFYFLFGCGTTPVDGVELFLAQFDYFRKTDLAIGEVVTGAFYASGQ